MSSPTGANTDRIAAARAFARSLNILLKYVRLYGAAHKLSTAQFATAWGELRAALPAQGDSGFVLGVSGTQLLLDGVPLECGASERAFAQLLTASGVASLQFFGGVGEADFERLVRIFAAAGSKPATMAEQLKKTFGKNTPIRVNEVRYVAHDADGAEPVVTELIARSLGADAQHVRDWLTDPTKLLQLIAAATGAQRNAGGTTNVAILNGEVQGQELAPADEEFRGVVRLLAQLGSVAPGESEEAALRQQLEQASDSVHAALQQALSAIAREKPSEQDPALLIKAAEHLAIKYALDRFERGEVRVNAVREMLDRMAREMEQLRTVLRAHEDKMERAGLLAESHADILDRQFWAAVPEAGKRSVLTSPDAWCIPPRNVRQYVEALLERHDFQTASAVLRNYAACIGNRDADARRKTAIGTTDMADLYGRSGPGLLFAAVRAVSAQLKIEAELDLQALLSAALVRLTQEAGSMQDFAAIDHALAAVEAVQEERPAIAGDLRRRIGVENRLRKFLTDAVTLQRVPPELLDVLRHDRRNTMHEVTGLYAGATRRDHCERLLEIARQLGPEAIGCLRESLRARPAGEAVGTLGLLAELDGSAITEWLPKRLPEWGRAQHDAVVRQIAAAPSSHRGLLLLQLLPSLDPAVHPETLDEIGMSGDSAAAIHLLRLAEGELPKNASPYLQVKAIEALGRMRDMNAIPVLRILAQARGLLGWRFPREVRMVATQSLSKLDPEFVHEFLPASGLDPAELSLAPLDAGGSGWVRQRRYPRITPERMLSATATTPRGRCGLAIRSLSLGGGMATRDGRGQIGADAKLDLQFSFRSHLHPEVLVREIGARDVTFEIVNIDLEERSRLRRFLAEQAQSRSLSPIGAIAVPKAAAL